LLLTGLINVFAALVGAVVGGTFILTAQGRDFRRRSIIAARLLLAEMKANGAVARELVGTSTPDGVYPEAGPSPAFFSTRIWESRAILMPEFLDRERIALLTELYRRIDSLMRARRTDGRYLSSHWIPGRVSDVANRMKDAATGLESAIDAEGQLRWWSKIWKALRLLLH
jgi:hypothetical protein